ncbi:MAG TPA: NDP-sugar synthase [Acidimicrobiales bacterium]|nr:NDP-sugar synthase [Acidimicrobiales bacterium]
MKAVILVGGEGTRLRPLTYAVPKQMLPVVEVPLIERVLAHLVAHGVTDVVLSLGYRPDAFIEAFPDGRCAGASLAYAVEAQPLDTAGAIRFAATEAGIDETFLVFNGDVLSDLDISALVAFHRTRGAEGTIALTPVEDPSAFGVVPTSDDGRVQAFIEKPAPGTAPTNLINAGAYVLEPSVLTRIAATGRVNVERETFPAMVAVGTLFALASDRYWIDVGTPDRYLQATVDILNGLRPGVPAPGARRLDGAGWAAGEHRNEGTVTRSFLGAGAVVGRGGAVATSVVGRGATVGEDAVVEGSVLLAGASVEKGAEVRDTIVGPRAIVGAGAVLRALSVVGAEVAVPAGAFHEGARLPA